MNIIEQIIAQAMAESQPQQTIPAYWQLSQAMENLGFDPHLYIDGQFVAVNAGNPDIEGALVVHKPPVALFWTRDDGQQVIQCAKENGESQLFWTVAAADIQSQLTYLADRFASPTILGNPAGTGVATGQAPGGGETAAGA